MHQKSKLLTAVVFFTGCTSTHLSPFNEYLQYQMSLGFILLFSDLLSLPPFIIIAQPLNLHASSTRLRTIQQDTRECLHLCIRH